MPLNTVTMGPDTPDLPPVLLAHGLLGQARNLGVIARMLATTRKVVSVDMRNHGESFWDSDHSYAALAGDLAEVIGGLGGEADVVGHSMGGKAAMTLALTRPDTIRRLVVLDIAPIAYGHTQTPLIEALLAADLNGITRRSEADARLAPAVSDPGTRAFVLQSLEIGPPARWKMNLNGLRAAMGDLIGWPKGLTPGFAGPVLAMAGGRSDYVTADGETALRHYFPQVTLQRIAGAGHWLHAEAPEVVGPAIVDFLS